MRDKREVTIGEMIWEMLLAAVFLVTIIINMVYVWQGKITAYESNLANMICFGVLWILRRIDRTCQR